VWAARNRFAVFSKENQTIEIKDLNNSVTRSIKPPESGVMDIPMVGRGISCFAHKHKSFYTIFKKRKQSLN
jgi:coatomer subunit alpha